MKSVVGQIGDKVIRDGDIKNPAEFINLPGWKEIKDKCLSCGGKLVASKTQPLYEFSHGYSCESCGKHYIKPA